MATNSAERQRRHRARKAADRACLVVEVEETGLAAVLYDHTDENGDRVFLHTENPTRQELAAAVERVLESIVTRYSIEKWGERDW